MTTPQTYIWLNGVKLPITAPVKWDKVTPFPDQLMTSSPTVADYTPTSKQSWGSLKGGMGIEKWTQENNDRYSEADGVDASINVQSLAPLVTTMGAFGTQPAKITTFDNKIWAIGNNKIAYWTGSTWTVTKSNFSNPTDAVIFYGVSS